MKYVSFFTIGFICFAMLLLSCEKDDIEVSNTEYVSGGIGTSQTTGAIEFNFKVPRKYAAGKVNIELIENNILNEVIGTGDKQIKFLNVSAGTYHYIFEFWALENTFSSGGIDEGVPLNMFFTLNETLEVRNGQTLKIKVNLD